MSAALNATSFPLDNYELDDRYRRESGRVFLTGTQALVRIALMQRTMDKVKESLAGADHIAEWGVVNTMVKDTVAKFLYDETHRRPMVLPVSVEV